MDGSLFVTNLRIDDATVTLSTDWKGNAIELTLYDCVEAGRHYTGTLLLKDLQDTAVELEIPYETFLQENIEALTKQCDHFRYQIETASDSSDGQCTFKWKKASDLGNIIYGTVQMGVTKEKTLFGLCQSLVAENQTLKEQNKQLETDSNALKVSYEALSDVARRTEQVLLTKCRLIINSKKQKIRELEERLKAHDKPDSQGKESAEKHSEETPICKPALKLAATRLNLESSDSDSQPIEVNLPKRSKIHENIIETYLIEDESTKEDVPADEDLFEEL